MALRLDCSDIEDRKDSPRRDNRRVTRRRPRSTKAADYYRFCEPLPETDDPELFQEQFDDWQHPREISGLVRTENPR